MKSRMLMILMIFTSGFSYAQSGNLVIGLNGASFIAFCKDSVQFGPIVKVEGDSIYDGLKVSIANYKVGAESLTCKSLGASLTQSWSNSTGTLELRGAATAQEYQDAVEHTWYYNINAIPDTTTRQIAISLIDADFLPATGHFYQFIQQWDIKWTQAKDSAEARNYRGLQGYLGTITSEVENDFIWTKVSGVGWIGATDANEYSTEGDWKWVTGPEAGRIFWRGIYDGSPVNGEYSYWSNGEPNNSYTGLNGGVGEDYAHITQDPTQPPKSWNDLRDEGDGPDSPYYRPKGYVVEYGGMPGDPDLKLSTAFDIKIRKVIFSPTADQTICRYDSVRLNQSFKGDYIWSPISGLSDAYGPTPFASPFDSTQYKAVANYDGCIDSAMFRVNVKPVPVIDLGVDRDLCAGDNTVLEALAENDDALLTYLWNTGANTQKITVTDAGDYSVLVTNQYTCSSSDTIAVNVHDYPRITIADKDALYCDSRNATTLASVDKGTVSWTSPKLTFTDPTMAGAEVQAPDTGQYQAYIEVTDIYNCVSRDTVLLSFFDAPSTDLSIDSTTCSGYSLRVDYTGNASDDAFFSWYFPDTIYTEGPGIKELELQLGFQQTNQRKLGLQVSESGCQRELVWTPIRVTPNLEVMADITEGCMPLTVNFTAVTTEDIDAYTWEAGEGLEQSTPDPTIQYEYKYAGTYDVTLKVLSKDGCTNTGTMKDFVLVHPIKTVYTDIDPNDCYPHEFDVNYDGTGNDNDSYNWDLSGLDPEEIVYDPGTTMGPVRISLRNKPKATIGLQVISEFGCVSGKKEFTVKRRPWFELSVDPLSGCWPLTVNMSALPSDQMDRLDYIWDTGLNTKTGRQIAEEYSDQGAQYRVSAIGISAVTGCTDTVLMADPIEVYNDPIAAFDIDKTEKLISDPVFRFVNQTIGGSSFEWDFGDGQTSVEENPENRYQEVGWFTVFLQAESEYGCVDTVSRRLLVAPDELFAPNALNPNSINPENHVFLLATDAVKAEGYRMLIFNRWGEQVFESANKTVGWDGKMKNGSFAPAGTYVWILSYRDVLDKPHKQKGTVTLVF